MIIAHHFFNWVTYEDRNIMDLPQEAVKDLLKKYRAKAKKS
jgi:hypothetical protein